MRPVCETLLSLAVSLSGAARALTQPPMALVEPVSNAALPAAAQCGSGATPDGMDQVFQTRL